MPTFIRQVKASEWASLQDGDVSDEAVARAVDGLFACGLPSVFIADDLRGVALIALARMSKVSEGRFDFVDIWPEQLDALQVRAKQTPGDTLLPYANERHYELEVDRPAADRLVRLLSHPKAYLTTLSKKTLKELARLHWAEIHLHAPEAWFFK